MINLKGIPLLHQDECKEIFSSQRSWVGYYFIKPIYKLLPDFEGLDDPEKFWFKDLEKGMYLVGLQVIADKWVNKGFCGLLLNKYGLVLDDAYPIVKKGKTAFKEDSMIMLNFNHIGFALDDINVSVVPEI